MAVAFGTGGWRAIIGDEFTRANVELVCAALGRQMHQEGVAAKGLVIGYDRRFLSDEAAKWAAECFAGMQIPVRVITGQSPTPLIMFTVKRDELPYGMAITASHNPALYNGIKVFTAGGRDADEATTQRLEEQMLQVDQAELPTSRLAYERAMAAGLVTEISPFNDYIDSILSQVDDGIIRSAHLKVALDPMFGVSRTSLQTILLTSRCEVEVIHDRHDTLFGGRLPSPSSHTLNALTDYVLEHHCDLGIATDGDADRLGIIDDRGQFLHPNQLLVLLYYYLLNSKGWKGPVVRNVATTTLLDEVAERFGEQCFEVPVGFKHISSKMAETGAIIGGESSGGLTVRGHIAGKDGIYAAALLVEMIASAGKPLSEIYSDITSEFSPHYMAELDIAFDPERKAELIQTLFEDKQIPEFAWPVVSRSYLDGCKLYFDEGWIIVRFSGTEPVLRIFCEMPTEAEAKRGCAQFRHFLAL